MARKANNITFDIDFNTNAKSIFDEIGKVSSKSGKAMEKALSDALNHAQQSLQNYADMQKKILAGATDISKPVYENARKVAKASTEFVKVYANAQSNANNMTEVLTKPYQTLEDEIKNVIALNKEYGDQKKDAQKNIELLQAVQVYEQNKQKIEECLALEKQYEASIESVNKKLETRKRHINENNEAYNAAIMRGESPEEQKLQQIDMLSDRAYKSFSTNIENLYSKINEMSPYLQMAHEYERAMVLLNVNGIQPTTQSLEEETARFHENASAIKENELRIAELRKQQEEMASNPDVGKFEYRGIDPEAKDRIFDAASAMEQLYADAMQANKATEEMAKNSDKAGKGYKSLTLYGYSLSKAIKDALFHHKSLHKSHKNFFSDTGKGFKHLLRNIMRYGLGVRSLYFLFRRLRSAVKESFKVMALSIPEVNTQVSSLVTSMNQMKASLATMIQPLLKVIVPAFQTIAHYAQMAMEWIGKLFAVFTGQNYIYRASAAWVDYADSVNGATKAINNLLGIDELNVLNQDEGKGLGGVFSPGTIDYEQIDAVGGIFEKIKEAWNNADFTQLGTALAEKFKSALKSVQDNLPGIEEFSRKVVLSLATGINGVVNTDTNLGYTMGETIAKLIGVGIRSLSLFFTTVNWTDVGTFIAEGINGFVDNINPQDLADFINAVIEGIETALITAVTKINWGRIVQVFKETWTNFSTTSKVTLILLPIVWTLGKMIIGFTSALLSTKLATALGGASAGVAAMHGIATGGALIALGILATVTISFFGKLGKWYLESDFHRNMSTSLEHLVGIDSSKTTTGGKHFIVDFVDNIIDNVKSVFSDKQGEGEQLIEGSVGAWIAGAQDDIITTFGDIVYDLVDEIADSGEHAGEGFVEGLQSVDMPYMASKEFGEMTDSVEKRLQIHSPSKVFRQIGQNVIDGFLLPFKSGFIGQFVSIWQKLTVAVKAPINTMITYMNRFIEAVQTMQNSVADAFNTFNFDVPEALGGGRATMNLTRWTAPKIPYLAQGAVIPPNSQFLAVLGDQKQGTNIEAPLSTIQEAVANVLEPYLRQIANNTQALTEKDYATYIGDREIAMANSRGSRQLGLALIQ